MKVPHYLICEMPENLKGIGLILDTGGDNQIGRIAQFKTDDELAAFKVSTNNLFAQMDGYRIVVIDEGFLNPPDRVSEKQIVESLEEMAAFYKQTKIEKNAGYYKRYKQEG